MEDNDMESAPSGSLVLVALAVLAIVLGGAGLYFGLTANQRLSPLAETMEAGSSSAARFEKDISGLKAQLAELSAQSAELKGAVDRVKLYSNQAERAVKTVASGVKENRNEIVELADRINKVITTGVRPSTVATTSTATTTAAPAPESSPSESTGSAGTYTIASGDTFAKVAGKLGVSLQALLDANPDADPRRLAIGQVINVPGH